MRDGGLNGGGASPLLNLSQDNGSERIGDGGGIYVDQTFWWLPAECSLADSFAPI